HCGGSPARGRRRLRCRGAERRRFSIAAGKAPRSVRGRRSDRRRGAHPCRSPVGALGRPVGGDREPPGRPHPPGDRRPRPRAPPAGCPLLAPPISSRFNPARGQKLPYATDKVFAPVSMVATQPVALVANKSFPANTIPELVAVARESAPPLNFTSPGPRGV